MFTVSVTKTSVSWIATGNVDGITAIQIVYSRKHRMSKNSKALGRRQKLITFYNREIELINVKLLLLKYDITM